MVGQRYRGLYKYENSEVLPWCRCILTANLNIPLFLSPLPLFVDNRPAYVPLLPSSFPTAPPPSGLPAVISTTKIPPQAAQRKRPTRKIKKFAFSDDTKLLLQSVVENQNAHIIYYLQEWRRYIVASKTASHLRYIFGKRSQESRTSKKRCARLWRNAKNEWTEQAAFLGELLEYLLAEKSKIEKRKKKRKNNLISASKCL